MLVFLKVTWHIYSKFITDIIKSSIPIKSCELIEEWNGLGNDQALALAKVASIEQTVCQARVARWHHILTLVR